MFFLRNLRVLQWRFQSLTCEIFSEFATRGLAVDFGVLGNGDSRESVSALTEKQLPLRFGMVEEIQTCCVWPSRGARGGGFSLSEKRTSATDCNWCTNLLDRQFGEIIIVSSLSFRGPPPPRHRLFPFSIFRFSCSLFCGFRLVSTVGRVTFSNASTRNYDRWSMSLTVSFGLSMKYFSWEIYACCSDVFRV